MNAFEQNLWRDVVREYGAELARAEWPGHRRRARPRLVVGTTAATAAVGVALALLLSGTASPPAFAVTGGPNSRTLVIAARQIQITPAQIARFNRMLASMGARTGHTETLVETASGVEVRCSGPHGQVVRATIRTMQAPPGPAAADAPRGPVTVVAWRCAGPNAGSGAGAGRDRAINPGAAPR